MYVLGRPKGRDVAVEKELNKYLTWPSDMFCIFQCLPGPFTPPNSLQVQYILQLNAVSTPTTTCFLSISFVYSLLPLPIASNSTDPK